MTNQRHQMTDHIQKRATACIVAILSGLSLTACVSPMIDHSPDYHYAQAIDAGGMTTSVLMPNRCQLEPGAPENAMPLGCANAYNLQRMVERERDLMSGRPLGPSPAAPAARAAQRYLNGTPPAAKSPEKTTSPAVR